MTRTSRLALWLAPLAGCAHEPPGVERGASVVLMIVDTLRADALGCYGRAGAETPHVDALAASGARFETCWAQAPNTATSHATLFTGLHPWCHRVATVTSLERGTAGLPDAFTTLAERFAAAGYETAAFTDGGPLGRAWNLMQGFEVLEARYEGVAAKVDAALAWLDARERARPFFLLLHTYEVHVPYLPPAELAERFDPGYDGVLVAAEAEARALRAAGGERQPDGLVQLREKARFSERDVEHLRRMYAAEVALTDVHLGRLFEHLRESGQLARAVVALTSDHGEEFGEHGEFGHVQLHAETLRVPLIVKLAGERAPGAGTISKTPARLIDLHPTLLEAVGLEPGAECEGLSLVGGIAGGRFAAEPAFAETTEPLYLPGLAFQRSVRAGERLLIATEREGVISARLFDLTADPLERAPSWSSADLAAEAPPESAAASAAFELARAIERHLAAEERLRLALLAGRSTVVVMHTDPATDAELRALGYAGGASEE